jgi:energy-converting hydrogenase A subunit M
MSRKSLSSYERETRRADEYFLRKRLETLDENSLLVIRNLILEEFSDADEDIIRRVLEEVLEVEPEEWSEILMED